MESGPDEVYDRLYKKVIQRNEAYYQKYPEDVDRVRKIVTLLQKFGDSTVRLLSEGSLSARRFQQLGLRFGAHGMQYFVLQTSHANTSPGGIDTVHGMLTDLS